MADGTDEDGAHAGRRGSGMDNLVPRSFPLRLWLKCHAAIDFRQAGMQGAPNPARFCDLQTR